MADRDATWRLALARDPRAKAEARAFAKDIIDEDTKTQSTLLRSQQELERKKSAILKQELEARTQAERLALRKVEEARKASLAKQLADTRLARLEEARINSQGGGIVAPGGLGTRPRTMGGRPGDNAGDRVGGRIGGGVADAIGSAVSGNIPSSGNYGIDSAVQTVLFEGLRRGISQISTRGLGAALKSPLGAILAGALAAAVGSVELIMGGGKFKSGSWGEWVGKGALTADRAVAGAFDTVTGGNSRKNTDLGKLEASNDRLAKMEKVAEQYREMLKNQDKRIAEAVDARNTFADQSEKAEQKMVAHGRERLKNEREILKAKGDILRDTLKQSQAELAAARERIAAERQVLASTIERFGAMDRNAQTDVLEAVKKARAGGKLSGEELGSLSSLGTKEADRIVRQQNMANAAGDRSGPNMQLEAIANQRRLLQSERAQIQANAPDKYNAEGQIVGKLVGRERSQQYDSIEERLKQLAEAETRIRVDVAGDTMLRQSLFAGERRDVARAGQQATTIRAQVNHQINVVNNFEFTAKEIAEQATQRMIESMMPYMAQVDREIARMTKDIKGLVETRKKTVPGRSS